MLVDQKELCFPIAENTWKDLQSKPFGVELNQFKDPEPLYNVAMLIFVTLELHIIEKIANPRIFELIFSHRDNSAVICKSR